MLAIDDCISIYRQSASPWFCHQSATRAGRESNYFSIILAVQVHHYWDISARMLGKKPLSGIETPMINGARDAITI
jgi:hypothetical protein